MEPSNEQLEAQIGELRAALEEQRQAHQALWEGHSCLLAEVMGTRLTLLSCLSRSPEGIAKLQEECSKYPTVLREVGLTELQVSQAMEVIERHLQLSGMDLAAKPANSGVIANLAQGALGVLSPERWTLGGWAAFIALCGAMWLLAQ